MGSPWCPGTTVRSLIRWHPRMHVCPAAVVGFRVNFAMHNFLLTFWPKICILMHWSYLQLWLRSSCGQALGCLLWQFNRCDCDQFRGHTGCFPAKLLAWIFFSSIRWVWDSGAKFEHGGQSGGWPMFLGFTSPWRAVWQRESFVAADLERPTSYFSFTHSFMVITSPCRWPTWYSPKGAEGFH